MNLSRYVKNNVTNLTDPSGLQPPDSHGSDSPQLPETPIPFDPDFPSNPIDPESGFPPVLPPREDPFFPPFNPDAPSGFPGVPRSSDGPLSPGDGSDDGWVTRPTGVGGWVFDKVVDPIQEECKKILDDPLGWGFGKGRGFLDGIGGLKDLPREAGPYKPPGNGFGIDRDKNGDIDFSLSIGRTCTIGPHSTLNFGGKIDVDIDKRGRGRIDGFDFGIGTDHKF